MTQIKDGQYEVILRKKWKTDSGILVPVRIKEVKGIQDPTKTYCTLCLYIEFRSDIPENSELIGKRLEIQRPFIKEIDNTDGTTLKKDLPFLKSFYDSVDADNNFLWSELAEYLINKPVLIDLIVKCTEKNGIKYTNYNIKGIKRTKMPNIQPSALDDIADNKEDITLLDYDI